MKNQLLIIATSTLMASCFSPSSQQVTPKRQNAMYRAELLISSSQEHTIPFLFSIKGDSLFFHNGKETLSYSTTTSGDRIEVLLLPYNATLKLWDDYSQGEWIEHDKQRTTPIRISQGDQRFGETKTSTATLHNRYKVIFGKGENAYPAIAEFSQKGDIVYGTFLTETGDYRFLTGVVDNNRLKLSTFDGAHAFLFTANLTENGELVNGTFYSGPTYTNTWSGMPNDTFTLRDADNITKQKEGVSAFNFTIEDPNHGNIDISHSWLQNKVTLIQILGTWCPNCKDETRFLKELYETYHLDGLGILGVAYEYSKDPLEAQERIAAYVASMSIPYPIAYGGKADKKLVTENFYTLDKVVSFPTLIVLDSNKNVHSIHTGFSGPATSAYEELSQGIHREITRLLK